MWLVAATVCTGALGGPLAPVAAAGAPSGLTWSRLSPPERPPAVEESAAAYDGADHTVVLFGGKVAGGHLSNQTWVWNGSTWTLEAAGGATPPAREGASMAFDARLDQLILFGGEGTGGELLDDTWAWNGASWTEVATAQTPGGREGAALAGDADGHLVLFGGYGTTNGSPPPPKTTTTRRTVPDRPKHRRPKKPAPTTTTTTPKKTTTTTTTVPPKTTTTTTTPTTTAPSTTTTTTTTPTHGPDTTTTSTTTTLPKAGPSVPASTSGRRTGRAAARLTSVSEATSGARVLGDTWILSRAADGGDQWTQAVTRTAPPRRADAALSAGTGNQTILFGGTASGPEADPQGALRGDTWIWDGQAWSKPKLSAAPPPRMLSDFQDAVGPGGLGHAVLFGGLAATRSLDDTWLWDGRAWQRLSPASPAGARSGAAAAYDEMDAQYVLFGGRSAVGRLISDTQVLTTHPPQRVVTSPAGPAGGSANGGSGPSGSSGGTGGGSGGSGRSGGSGTSAGSGGSSGGSGRTSTSGTTPTTGETKVHRGGLIRLFGSGFKPYTRVTITFHSKVQTIGVVHARADGTFLANVVVPGGAVLGAHHFDAVGRGQHGRMIDLRRAVDVVAVLGHGVAEWAKATMVAIAIAIPVVSWFVIGLFSRRRPVRRA